MEKLITLFLDNKTAQEANRILKYHFVDSPLNIKTIYKYYEMFDIIVHAIVELFEATFSDNGAWFASFSKSSFSLD